MLDTVENIPPPPTPQKHAANQKYMASRAQQMENAVAFANDHRKDVGKILKGMLDNANCSVRKFGVMLLDAKRTTDVRDTNYGKSLIDGGGYWSLARLQVALDATETVLENFMKGIGMPCDEAPPTITTNIPISERDALEKLIFMGTAKSAVFARKLKSLCGPSPDGKLRKLATLLVNRHIVDVNYMQHVADEMHWTTAAKFETAAEFFGLSITAFYMAIRDAPDRRSTPSTAAKKTPTKRVVDNPQPDTHTPPHNLPIDSTSQNGISFQLLSVMEVSMDATMTIPASMLLQPEAANEIAEHGADADTKLADTDKKALLDYLNGNPQDAGQRVKALLKELDIPTSRFNHAMVHDGSSSKKVRSTKGYDMLGGRKVWKTEHIARLESLTGLAADVIHSRLPAISDDALAELTAKRAARKAPKSQGPSTVADQPAKAGEANSVATAPLIEAPIQPVLQDVKVLSLDGRIADQYRDLIGLLLEEVSSLPDTERRKLMEDMHDAVKLRLKP